MKKNRGALIKCLIAVCLSFLMPIQASAQLRFGIKGGYDISSNDIWEKRTDTWSVDLTYFF